MKIHDFSGKKGALTFFGKKKDGAGTFFRLKKDGVEKNLKNVSAFFSGGLQISNTADHII